MRYHDLLADWTSTVVRMGEELELPEITNAETPMMQEVHAFVDPQLRRVKHTWDDLSVPDNLRELAQGTWEQLNLLAEPGGDVPGVHDKLDELRRAYGDLYAEAEALARSSVEAAGPVYVRDQERARAEEAAAAYAAAGPVRKSYLRSRRVAGRVKRRLQRPAEDA